MEDAVLCFVSLLLLTCASSLYDSDIAKAPFAQMRVSLKLFMCLALHLHKISIFTESADSDTEAANVSDKNATFYWHNSQATLT